MTDLLIAVIDLLTFAATWMFGANDLQLTTHYSIIFIMGCASMYKLILLQANLHNGDIHKALLIRNPRSPQYTQSFELFEYTHVFGVSLHRETGFAVLSGGREWVLVDNGAECVEDTRAE
jgi:hypothetical protein